MSIASGEHSHAEGYSTEAKAWASHAGGWGTSASAQAQTAIGRWNKEENDALFIVGNGSENNRQNAMSVKANGAVKSIGTNQVLCSKFIEPNVVIGNGTFDISHYSVVNLGIMTGENCIASVRKDGTDCVIEGTLLHSTGNGNGYIRKIKIITNASAKVTYMEIISVNIYSGVSTVSEWIAGNGTNPDIWVNAVIGLVPIH